MDDAERRWLLNHLSAQVEHLRHLVTEADGHPGDAQRLVAVRDAIFTARETLETLEVPLATASNDAWGKRSEQT